MSAYSPDWRRGNIPRYDYRCTACGRVTERVIPLVKAPGPAKIKCKCGKQAKRVSVYSVGIRGDLPTRGAF